MIGKRGLGSSGGTYHSHVERIGCVPLNRTDIRDMTRRPRQIANMAPKIINTETNRRYCSCFGCERVATRFTGSKKRGWLRFCSKHSDVAAALSLYFTRHPNAR